MAERIWARDRLFRGLELDDLRSGDRRIVEDTAVASTRQEFDPMIGGTGDRRVVIDVDLDRPVDERDDSYVDPDESCEQLLHGLVPSREGANPWRVIEPERTSSPVTTPSVADPDFEEGDEVCREKCGEGGHTGLCLVEVPVVPFGRRRGEVGVKNVRPLSK